ncbi:MAG: polymer-forming cytoskeletal protein, partial [Gemmatimonadetes bacterium]|nr:polymer-forming cytoskeletal protein [Gemmatimonadota bacterium]
MRELIMRKQKQGSLGVSCLALAALCTMAGCSETVDSQTRISTVRRGGDVVAAGRSLLLSDSVPGDIMLAGQSLTFDGFAGGSYVGAGADQTVTGEVRGSVRAAGGSIELDAAVGRNVTLAGGSVTVQRGTQIAGNAYLAGGTVSFQGTGSGDVDIRASEAILDGIVEGDVRVEAGALTIGPDARILGELRYRMKPEAQPQVSAQADVAGQLVELEADEGGGLGWLVFKLLALVLAASAVAALFPAPLTGTARELERRPIAALGFGILWVLAVPLVIVVTAATIIGIPMALILAAAYAASLYLAPVVPALWIGNEMFRGREPDDRGSAVLLTVVGSAVVAVALLLPWIGFLTRV